MLQNVGLPEIIIILLVILIFLGPKYLSDLARELGHAGKELKNIKKEYNEAVEEINAPEPSEDSKPTKKKVDHLEEGGESS